MTQNEIARYFPLNLKKFLGLFIVAISTHSMQAGHKTGVVPSVSRLNKSFQKLLLEFSATAARTSDPDSLISTFLAATRAFFAADGAYFWRLVAPDTILGTAADGHMAADFPGVRLNPEEGAIAAQAVRTRGTIFVNGPEASRSPLAARFHARSIMAAPLIVAGEVIGAVVLLHTSDPKFFNDDLAGKAAILAGQLGAFLEAIRLTDVSRARAEELRQLLDISCELGGISNLDQFLQKFVVRAAEFLAFRRCYIALLESESCQVRWVSQDGVARPLSVQFPASVAASVLANKEVFWTDDIRKLPQTDQKAAAEFEVRQILTVPLIGSDGSPLGMFGVLDRSDDAGISPEDIRRARALAAQITVALEATRNLHLSEEHRRRAEDLTALALELNPLLRLPEFAKNFTTRAASMLGARDSALALANPSLLEVVVLHAPESSFQSSTDDKTGLRRLASTLGQIISEQPPGIISGQASDLLGQALASDLGWTDFLLVRLFGSDSELLGVVCLANRGKALSQSDEYLLQALAGHASVALENSRLFTRMDQANRHWMEIFDAITDFMVVHDESHKVLRVNRTLADFIGVHPSELIGVSMHALLAMTSDLSERPCPFCATPKDSADEYVHPISERTYLISTSRIHGANSEGLQTIHVLKDISDRREVERRYRELFDNIQEGLYFSSPEGRFVEVNDALVRMLGYNSREELLNVDIAAQIYTSPAQRQRFRSLLDQKGTLRNHEETLRRRDGSPITTLQNVFAVRDPEGNILQYRGLMLDITELKNSETQLQRERDFNNKILNNTQSIILVTDTAGQITYANRRWYESGSYNPQELLGQPLAELAVPSRRGALISALELTLRGQQVDNLQLPVLRADGQVGHFSINLSPMRDEQGEVSSIVVVMTDVTDSAMLHSKLLHTEKMAAVGQLVSGVAHEVNNPLTAILGFADLLMENPELPETAKKDLRVILQEAQRTKLIVQNLLSFARQMPPQRVSVQVNPILRRTLQLRAYDFASHGVEIVERLQEGVPEIIGDAHQLQQVFLNILNNAYDAVKDTTRPARIEIESSWGEGYAQVLFRDNGSGIAFPDRIFDPFFTTKEVGKGTGLGLSICYGIVHEHGGEIVCHNNIGREGATFIVRLPTVPQLATASMVVAGEMRQ